EAELALGDELEHDGGRVGLGQARDLVVIAGIHRRLVAEVSEASGEPHGAVPVADEQDRARDAGGDETVDTFLERGGPRVRGGRRLGGRGDREKRGRKTG